MTEQNKDFIYRTRKGPYDSEPCPFGAPTRIIILEKNGCLFGKCELAERARIQIESESFFTRLFSNDDLDTVMKKSGCPYPPKFNWRSKLEAQCKYNFGDYQPL